MLCEKFKKVFEKKKKKIPPIYVKYLKNIYRKFWIN